MMRHVIDLYSACTSFGLASMVLSISYLNKYIKSSVNLGYNRRKKLKHNGEKILNIKTINKGGIIGTTAFVNH
jgi:hypothetical protein